MVRSTRIAFFPGVLLSIFFLACGADDDPDQGPSADVIGGGDGDPALQSTTVRVVPVEDTSVCPNGGVVVHTYFDANADGELTPDEIIDSVVVCNGVDGERGADGDNGVSAAIATEPLAPGDECPSGGVLISWGLDRNGNGALDPDEVDGTTAVCNGEGSGETGCQLVPFGACSGADLSGRDLSALVLRGIQLDDANLENALLLQGTNLSVANLSGANLDGAELEDTVLIGADLRQTTSDGARMSGQVLLDEARLGGAVWTNVNANTLRLRDAQAEGSRIEGLTARTITLSGADARNASWTDWELERLTAETGTFDGADFSGLRWIESAGGSIVFDRASLVGALFTGAVLEGTVLRATEADFTDADFTDALLDTLLCQDADFSNASFRDAAFSGLASNLNVGCERTSFAGADFTNAVIPRVNASDLDFTDADFTGATLDLFVCRNCTWLGATCPEGRVIDTLGDTCIPLDCAPGEEPFHGECLPACSPGEERIDGVCTYIPCESNELRINGVCRPVLASPDDYPLDGPFAFFSAFEFPFEDDCCFDLNGNGEVDQGLMSFIDLYGVTDDELVFFQHVDRGEALVVAEFRGFDGLTPGPDAGISIWTPGTATPSGSEGAADRASGLGAFVLQSDDFLQLNEGVTGARYEFNTVRMEGERIVAGPSSFFPLPYLAETMSDTPTPPLLQLSTNGWVELEPAYLSFPPLEDTNGVRTLPLQGHLGGAIDAFVMVNGWNHQFEECHCLGVEGGDLFRANIVDGELDFSCNPLADFAACSEHEIEACTLAADACNFIGLASTFFDVDTTGDDVPNALSVGVNFTLSGASLELASE